MPDAQAHRESSEVRAGRVGLALALFVCFVAGSAAGLRQVYHWLAPNDAFAPVETFGRPRLLVTPDDARDPALAAQAAALDSYRWVDQAHGVVQVPIGRAMSWVAARGAQGYAPPPDPRETAP